MSQQADSQVPESRPTFMRPLRTADDTAVPVSVTHDASGTMSELLLSVESSSSLTPADQDLLKSQASFHYPQHDSDGLLGCAHASR